MIDTYSVDKNLEVVLNTAKFIGPGIQENVYLKEIKHGNTDKGNEFLAFYFEDAAGFKLSHTEWPVNAMKPLEEMTEVEATNYLTKKDNQKRRIGQIVCTFIPKDNYNFVVPSNTFKEYAENIIRLLEGKTEDIPIRVKVVYNNKNFTTLPNYWKYTFIEQMSIPSEKSSIKPLNIDKFVRTTPDLISNGIDSLSPIKEVSKEDLPF